jgi:hypothetical protein
MAGFLVARCSKLRHINQSQYNSPANRSLSDVFVRIIAYLFHGTLSTSLAGDITAE